MFIKSIDISRNGKLFHIYVHTPLIFNIHYCILVLLFHKLLVALRRFFHKDMVVIDCKWLGTFYINPCDSSHRKCVYHNWAFLGKLISKGDLQVLMSFCGDNIQYYNYAFHRIFSFYKHYHTSEFICDYGLCNIIFFLKLNHKNSFDLQLFYILNSFLRGNFLNIYDRMEESFYKAFRKLE